MGVGYERTNKTRGIVGNKWYSSNTSIQVRVNLIYIQMDALFYKHNDFCTRYAFLRPGSNGAQINHKYLEIFRTHVFESALKCRLRDKQIPGIELYVFQIIPQI